VVAVTARAAVNASDMRGRRLSLRLLREALEHDPGSLQKVLEDVLDLPQEQLEELRELLERTSLDKIISASRSITNRLEFLQALEALVLDPEHKDRVLERSQLHRILANETWVFGEEYTLAVDDQSLKEASRAAADARATYATGARSPAPALRARR
jgi:DNA-binding transcriptional MerR regulator